MAILIGIFIVFYTYLGYGILLYVLVKVKELFKTHKHRIARASS